MTDSRYTDLIETLNRLYTEPVDTFAELLEIAGLDGGKDIRGADLSEIDFSGEDLAEYDFRDCNLSGCRFDDADLHGARLDNANLSGASFRNSNIDSTSFARANLTLADFRGSVNLEEANLKRAILEDTKFDKKRVVGDLPLPPAISAVVGFGSVGAVSSSGLVAAVSRTTGLPTATCDLVLSTIVEQITQSLERGQQVSIVGFGTFSLKHRGARTGRNPKTGETVKISASNVPAFKAGKALKDAVN